MAATGNPQQQHLGRVRMREGYKSVLAGQAGTLVSVDEDQEMATVNFDWLTLPSTMAGLQKPQPNIEAQVPFTALAAIDADIEGEV